MKQINYILGNLKNHLYLNDPLSENIFNFCDDLSKIILQNRNSRKNLELFTFALWCRKKNLKLLSKNFNKEQIKEMQNLGVVFHIPPSNVIMNFAYSLIVGLLTSNKNIIRIPAKSKKLAIFVAKNLNLLKKKYPKIISLICFISYDHDKSISEKISKISDARIIWGSDETINEFKNIQSKINCRDIYFSDRYSIAMINTNKILNLSNEKLFKLCKNFYNDTYLFDQNACTSPQSILWIGNNSLIAKKKFWKCMERIVSNNYNLDYFSAINKFDNLSTLICRSNNISNFDNFKNLITRVNLKNVNALYKLRGNWGFFYEFNFKSIKKIKIPSSNKYQTLSHFGFSKQDLLKIYNNPYLRDFCRFVEIGKTMEFSLIWDGYDLINLLTKKISIK